MANYTYFKSGDVKVYPCANRGNYTKDGRNLTFNPSSRLETEQNKTNHYTKTGANDSYIISNSFEESGPFKVVIGGYYFEIAARAKDQIKNYLAIRLREVTLVNNGIDSEDSNFLCNLEDSDVKKLDASSSGTYYFYGLGTTDSLPTNAIYLKVKIDGQINYEAMSIEKTLQLGTRLKTIKTRQISSDLANIGEGEYSITLGEKNSNKANFGLIYGKENSTKENTSNQLIIGNENNTDFSNTIIIGNNNTAKAKEQLLIGDNFGVQADAANVAIKFYNLLQIDKDGGVKIFNSTTNLFNLDNNGSLLLNGGINAKAATFTGLTVNGSGSITGDLSVNGDITSDGDLTINTSGKGNIYANNLYATAKIIVGGNNGISIGTANISLPGKVSANNIETTAEIESGDYVSAVNELKAAKIGSSDNYQIKLNSDGIEAPKKLKLTNNTDSATIQLTSDGILEIIC